MNLVRPDEYEYNMLPMTDELFWNRVSWLIQAMTRAEDFQFRVMWYNKLQELMRHTP
jgi:hypothetical protein|tara:strand:+ start:2052 stop:2222 length:171 start_codon:yes stop_codon:yes gene_type:complete